MGVSELSADPRLCTARAILERYLPPTPEQEQVRTRMLDFIEAHPEDAHERSCLEGHLTASALVLDAAGKRALLTFHRKLGRWLQLGGHCDGDANLRHVALREACEESGMDNLTIGAEPIDLDIHAIPARPTALGRAAEPRHLHLDTRYLVRAAPGSVARLSEESIELGWFSPDQAASLDLDPSLLRIFQLAFS